jgi:glyoxylase-like metal-dependent hydrolase (beta-lactamase superfamily II)
VSKQSVLELASLGAKAYLIEGEHRSILVDTLFPWSGARTVGGLSKRGIEPRRIGLILLTHGHIDHFGNAAQLRRKTGAPVAIHELDADGPRRGRNVRLRTPNTFQRMLGLMAGSMRTRPFEPDILLRGDDGDLEEYGVMAKWVRTPGHSEGSVSIVLPGGPAIVGDLVVGRFGFRRRPAYPMWVSDRQQLKDGVKKLLDFGPTAFLSGHGGPLNPEDVRRLFLGG